MDEIFYAPGLIQGGTVLDSAESHHCLRVKRHVVGDQVLVFDGAGGLFQAEITSTVRGECTFRVLTETRMDEPLPQVHLAVAPPKNAARFEWMIEKLVEIGVSQVTPMHCKRSERVRLNTERLQRIVIEAAKQSGKLWLPKLNEMQPFEQVLKGREEGRFIAHLGDTGQSLQTAYQGQEGVLILIGPEGDFSSDELHTANGSDFKQVSLGPYRLRTETAAVVACHTINLLHG